MQFLMFPHCIPSENIHTENIPIGFDVAIIVRPRSSQKCLNVKPHFDSNGGMGWRGTTGGPQGGLGGVAALIMLIH